MPGRGGRGGRGGGGGSRPREEQISRALSKLLRHQAEKEGLKLGPGGYINLQDVLNNRNLRSLKITLPELRTIVADNDKQRFGLIHISEAPSSSTEDTTTPSTSSTATVEDDDDPSHYLIRANQGHSIALSSDGLLEPITPDAIPPTVVHGTTAKAWPLILASGGLRKMGRNHVHFASGLPSGFKTLNEDGVTKVEEQPVISGMRNSSSVLIFIDVRKAMEAGIKFWRSANGVILSEGDEGGKVGVEFFERVEVRKGGGGVVMVDGKLVDGANV